MEFKYLENMKRDLKIIKEIVQIKTRPIKSRFRERSFRIHIRIYVKETYVFSESSNAISDLSSLEETRKKFPFTYICTISAKEIILIDYTFAMSTSKKCKLTFYLNCVAILPNIINTRTYIRHKQ